MPDEIDTLNTSQVSNQTMDQGLGNTLNQSGTGAQTLTQGIGNNLGNSGSGSQTGSEGIGNTLVHFQSATHSLGRTSIPVTTIIKLGITPGSYYWAEPGANHILENLDERTFVEVVSIDGSAQTVSFVTSYSQDGLALDDRIVSIPAGSTKYIGNFPRHIYNHDLTDIHLDPSSHNLKLRAFRLI